MKTILALLIALPLLGCANVYEVRRCEGEVCSYALIKSRREFANGLEIVYNGEARTFEFRANKVDTAVSPLEIAAAQIITQLPGIVAAVPAE